MAAMLAKQDFISAYRTYRKSIPFPEIIARTCSQPCQAECNRSMVGGAIEIALLELAAFQHGFDPTIKITVLPKKKGRAAVIGGGISGVSAALELSKKGYQVSLFEAESHLGGSLWDLPSSLFPRDAIERELGVIHQTGVQIHLNEKVGPDLLRSTDFDVFLLAGGPSSTAVFDLDETAVDPLTYLTDRANVFAAGSLLHEPSTIKSLSDGRRAAISMDRFLQNVSLSAARVNEGSYKTRLVTNVANVKAEAPVPPARVDSGFSHEEAAAEAGRCLQCECMECVKACEYLRHYGSYPRKYVREIYNNLSIIMRSRTTNPFINSCMECGLCAEVCPTDLDMGEVNKDTRRTMVKTNHMPPSAHDFALRDMAFSNSDKFAGLFLPAGQKSCTDLFFPGCQLAASNPEYVSRLVEDLDARLDNVGVLLGCCGAPADWSGEEELFSRQTALVRTAWESAGKPRLVLACSACNQVFKSSLPDAVTVSVWELFNHGSLPEHAFHPDREYIIHDPCTSRYEIRWQDAARSLLANMDVPFRELKMSRTRTECCGYGGVAWLANPELTAQIIRRRVGEDEADYLTYCVMCRDLFAAQGKPTLHLLDLLYGTDPRALATRRPPDYSQRHENRIRVKQRMNKHYLGKDEWMPETYEKYQLDINEEMRRKIEDRLILVEDIQKVVEHAETTGERFVNPGNGHTLAYYKPNIITYWVEYTPQETTYHIHDAYSHRMDFEGDSSI
jgi:Fe-S oxidoreductase